jgi:hypothetical protein
MQVGELWVKIGGRNDDLKASMSQAEKAAKDAAGRLEKSSQALLKTVTVAATAAAAAITAIGVKSIEAAANSRAIEAQFEQVFGNVQQTAQDAVEELGNTFGMLPNRLKGPFTTTTSMFKGLGYDTQEAMKMAEQGVTIAADAAAFYDKSYEDANAALNSFIKGNYEGGEAIGLFGNETQIAAYASDKLGISWKDAGEAQKQLARLEYAKAMQEAAGATGQAARESEGYQNQLGNLKQGWTDFLAVIGTPLLEPVVNALKGLTEHLSTLRDLVTDEGLAGAIEKIIPDWLEGAIFAVAGAITVAIIPALIGMATAAWAAVAPLLPFLAAGAAIGALAYLIIKNWGPIKGFFLNLWTGVVDKWNGFKNSVMEIFAGIKASVLEVVNGAIQWGRDLVQGFINGIQEKLAAVQQVASNLANSIKERINNPFDFGSPSKVMKQFGKWVAEGLTVGMEEGTDKAAEAAQKLSQAITDAVQTMNLSLTNTLDLTVARLDLEAMKLSDNATETEKLNIELKKLNAEKDAQIEKIEVITAAYEMAKEKLGENNETTRQYAQELQLAQVELEKTEVSIKKMSVAIDKSVEAQVTALNSLADEITAVEEKYRDDLASAMEDYQEKVQRVNEKLIQDEQNVTQQYENALASRADALSNFVGLFDQVSNKNVSGASLLANLQGQVDSFEGWSANIATLAARGVDEGLIEELRQMGPKAGPEIAALNTLTDEQLQQYVALWKEKNQMARQEASNQLEQQRVEMEQKLEEIRANASEQLEQYRLEWAEKNAEIKKNTDEELTKIQNKFKELAKNSTRYGKEFVMGFVTGMESKFDDLRKAVAEMAAIVDGGVTDPLEIESPSKLMASYGRFVIEGFMNGIKSSLPRLENVVAGMAMVTPATLGPSISNSTSSSYSPSLIMQPGAIQINSSNPREVEDVIMRALHKAGIR